MIKRPLIQILLWALITSLFSGCDGPRVSVYNVDKESKSPMETFAASSLQGDEEGELVWNTPLEWKVLKRTALSKNRYQGKNQGGETLISVSALPGAAANLQQNANLWRKEMNLPPLLPQEIEAFTSAKRFSELSGTEIYLFNQAQDKATLAAAIPQGNKVWYFKLVGNIQSVAREKKRFEGMLRSLQIVTTSDTPVDLTDSMLASTSVTIAPPDGWTEIANNEHRLKAYKIELTGLPPAEFTITRFEKENNSLMANINRWRRKLKLEPWPKDRFEQRTRTIKTDTYEFSTFDLKAETAEETAANNERMFIATFDDKKSVYYLKLRGGELLLETQRRNFIDVLNSVSISSIQTAQGVQR